MFRGLASINLDDKGRLAIPTKYRAELQECCESQLILTVSLDRCLSLYPLPEWESLERQLAKLPTLDKTAQAIRRLLIGHATECELDAQGRFLIPEPLRKKAGLEKRIAFVGQGSKFEIWDEENWNQAYEAMLDQNILGDLSNLAPGLASLSF